MSGLEILVLEGGKLIGGGITYHPPAPPVTGGPVTPAETRKSWEWPFSADSLWNTPVGDGLLHGGLTDSRAVAFRNWTAQLNYSTYSTPVNIAGAEGTPITLREVDAGTWTPSRGDHVVARAPQTIHLGGEMNTTTIYNNDGSITFTAVPDGFMALVDTVDETVTEMYKVTWTQGGAPTRILIGRKGTFDVYDLRGDGWTIRGSRAATTSFFAGLMRKWELSKAATDPKNAIRHALALAVPNELLLDPDVDGAWPTPGYQWPARGFDSNGRTAYSGPLRMGLQLVLRPDFDIENSGMSNEGMALAYAQRDYGCYIVDRSAYCSLYLEEGANTTAAGRMKTDWQNTISNNMVVVNNNSQANPGGPGTRVRPPAPAFA